MSRLIDADAVVQYLHEFRCADCDRRKGLKNGKVRFCYEIGDAPCRACDIGDTIEYFLDEDIAPTIDAIPVEWLEHLREKEMVDLMMNVYGRGDSDVCHAVCVVLDLWQKEQEAR